MFAIAFFTDRHMLHSAFGNERNVTKITQVTASLSAHLNSARLHLVASGTICKAECYKSLSLKITFRKFTCSRNHKTAGNLEEVCNKNAI